jgi:alpha-tubulin suppressor-like RCC1 family protein
MTASIYGMVEHFCYITESGGLYCCGPNNSYCLGDLVALDGIVNTMTQVGSSSWLHVACGLNNTLAVKSDGTLWAMGHNGNGQLGTGGTAPLTALTQIGVDTDWVFVTSGRRVCIAIKADGTLWAAGDNAYGATGTAGSGNILSFTQESTLATNWVKATTAGETSSNTYAMAVNTLGELWTTGQNNDSAQGQGTGYTTYTKVGSDTDWVDVVAGDGGSLARKSSGIVYFAGHNTSRTGGGGWTSTHTAIDAISYSSMSLGNYNTVLASTSGVTYVVGQNYDGQLGTLSHDTVYSASPVICPTSPSGSVEVFSTSLNAYVFTDSTLYTAGYEGLGGLANGSEADESVLSFTPVTFAFAVVVEPMLELLFDTANAIGSLGTWHIGTQLSDTGDLTNEDDYTIFNLLTASGVATDPVHIQIAAYTSLVGRAAVSDILNAAFYNLVGESAAGSEESVIEAASSLVDICVVAGVFANRIDAITAISQLVVSIDLLTNASVEQIEETAESVDLLVSLLRATQRLVEQASSAGQASSYIIATSLSVDAAYSAEEFSLQAIFNPALHDSATGFAHFTINGEVYTGWVMNTQNSAVTEYQGMNFNSLAKIGTKYYGATDEGVYELAGDASDVSTYIQSGLLDFGSTQYKAVTTAYLGVDVDGRIAVGVGVSEKSGVAQHWYEVTMDKEATDNVKVPIGRGLKGRYWKFEVASESMATFEALTVLPVVLTRKV